MCVCLPSLSTCPQQFKNKKYHKRQALLIKYLLGHQKSLQVHNSHLWTAFRPIFLPVDKSARTGTACRHDLSLAKKVGGKGTRDSCCVRCFHNLFSFLTEKNFLKSLGFMLYSSLFSFFYSWATEVSFRAEHLWLI